MKKLITLFMVIIVILCITTFQLSATQKVDVDDKIALYYSYIPFGTMVDYGTVYNTEKECVTDESVHMRPALWCVENWYRNGHPGYGESTFSYTMPEEADIPGAPAYEAFSVPYTAFNDIYTKMYGDSVSLPKERLLTFTACILFDYDANTNSYIVYNADRGGGDFVGGFFRSIVSYEYSDDGFLFIYETFYRQNGEEANATYYGDSKAKTQIASPDEAPFYRHTFIRSSDGDYCWYSTEPWSAAEMNNPVTKDAHNSYVMTLALVAVGAVFVCIAGLNRKKPT